MKNSFSELLSEIISQSDISKNEIIRACDIDRSSFFKFLNGNRIPTNDQLNKICNKLQLSPPEEKALRLEHTRITSGEKKVLSQQRIAQFLWRIEEGENIEIKERSVDYQEIDFGNTTVNGKTKVRELLINSITQELANRTGRCEIDAFLPPVADDIFTSLIPLIAGKSNCIRFRQLIELPSRNDHSEQLIMDRFRFALLCTLISPASYTGYYYYSGDSISSSIGVLYAYSLVTEHRVVLINERMNKAIVIDDQECCRDYRTHFISSLNSARPIIKKVDCEEVAAELNSPVLYFYGIRGWPGRTDASDSIIYLSLAEIRKIAGNEILPGESGYKEMSSNERTNVLINIKEKIGTHVFLIDEKNIPPAEVWCIALSGKEKLIIYKADSRFFFIITEPEIVQAFYGFMAELPDSGYLLRNDLALEIINDLIAGVN